MASTNDVEWTPDELLDELQALALSAGAESGSGSCHIQTADGASVASGWWNVTAAGTAECPAVCG